MCHLYPYKKIETSMEVFSTLIFAVLLVGANFYETWVLDNSYLRHKVKLPTSDSTEITAGGIKVRLEAT